MQLAQCKCGCGESLVLAKRNKYRKILPIFLQGHNSKTLEGKILFNTFARSPASMLKASKTKSEKYKAGLLFIPSRKGMTSPRKGVVLTLAEKEHLSKINLGKKHSLKTIEKLRQISISKGCGKHMLGKKLSEATKKKISDAHAGKMPANIGRPGKFMNISRGYFKIGDKEIYFRSKWEANYALYLNFLMNKGNIREWQYEEDNFIFDQIQSGTRSYRPDFKIYNLNGTIEYHEIKGWMTPRSKTQMKRMKKYYPDVKLILITSKDYKQLRSKLGKVIGFFQ